MYSHGKMIKQGYCDFYGQKLQPYRTHRTIHVQLKIPMNIIVFHIFISSYVDILTCWTRYGDNSWVFVYWAKCTVWAIYRGKGGGDI